MADYSDEQLAALKAALASGELRVEHNGRVVQYRSVKELQAAIGSVSAELNQAATKKPVRQYLVYAKSGLE